MIPTDFHIFQRGRYTTKQQYSRGFSDLTICFFHGKKIGIYSNNKHWKFLEIVTMRMLFRLPFGRLLYTPAGLQNHPFNSSNSEEFPLPCQIWFVSQMDRSENLRIDLI